MEKKIFKIGFIAVISLALLAAPYAHAELMQKPAKVNLTLSEGVQYNSNPGYADTGNRDRDWANQLNALLSIELPFGEIHKYSFNSNTTWLKYFRYHKFNQVNNNLSHSVDLTFNRWTLNLHQNFDATSEPNTNEMVIPAANTLLRKRVNAPGIAVRGDLGKLKLAGGFDYEDYDTNDAYKMLARKTYSPYMQAGVQITPLLDGFVSYSYSRTIHKRREINDSHGNNLSAGLRGELTRYLTGEITVGYAWLDFRQTGTTGDNSNYHGLVYSGTLTNRLSKLTTQQLTLSLSPEDGYNVGNYYKSYATKYLVNHTLNAKIDVNASAGYIYNKESGSEWGREKAHIWEFGGGFNYHLTKRSDFKVAYDFAEKSSNRHGKNYKQHSVSAGVNYTF